MARTKKSTTKPQETKTTEEASKVINVEASPTKISYSGKVEVQLQRNGKTVKSHIYHNTGYTDMFNYLAYCLGGQINEYLWSQILYLFYENDGLNYRVSDYTFKSSVEVDTTSIPYTTTFKFTVPYNSIITDLGKINKVVLTNLKNKNTMDDLIISNGVVDEWLKERSCAILSIDDRYAVDIDLLDVNTSIIIVWTMSLSDISSESEGN